MIENQNLFDEYDNNHKTFDDETKHNYDQLKYLIDYFNLNLSQESRSKDDNPSINSSLSNSSSSSLDSNCLRSLLTNLHNLIDYYRNQKCILKNLNFLKYLIIKRVNYFNNNLFNLNKKLVLRHDVDTTLFEMNSSYNNFDKTELNILSEILNKNLVKLHLSFQNSSEINKYTFFNHPNCHFKFIVYQFESTKRDNAPKTQKIKKSKRSLSAGARAPKAQTKFLSDENSSSDENECDFVNKNCLKLNEKCLKLDEFSIVSDSIFTLDLNPRTNRVLIVIYHMTYENKIPVLLESYEINEQVTLISSLNLTERKIEAQNSSMFRRIFKSKSKSKSRANSSQSKIQRAQSNFEIYPSSLFNLTLSFSNEFKHFVDPNNIISLERLDKWLKLWAPDIENCDLRYNGYKIETNDYVNISMSLISCNPEVNQRRSKFDQHQISKNITRDQEFYYYIKINLINSNLRPFTSNLFKLKDLKLNDLFQVKVQDDLKFKNFELLIELYSFDLSKRECTLIENKSITVNWENFYYNRENLVLNFRNLFNLKFKFLTIHNKMDRVQTDSVKFLNFVLTDQNELEFYNLAKIELKNDPFLIEKYLEFFSILSVSQKSNKKNLFRTKLLSRLYESFLTLIDSTNIDLTRVNLKLTQPKILQNWFLTNIKNLIEVNTPQVLELTLRNFDFLIQLMVHLSTKSNSQFELKYNLNDLILIKFQKFLKRDFLIEHLNIKFIDHLQELFNGTELGSMCVKLLGLEGNDNIFLKNQVINLEVFSENYQFRDRVCQVLQNDSVEFLKMILKLKSKLSQSHLESLINVSFKSILTSLIDNFKNEDLSQSIIDNFLVLVELVDLIMSSNRFNFFETFDKHLIHLFDVIECYFKYNQSFLQAQFRLCLEIDLILFKFFKYIQKYLLRFLISKSNLELEVLLFKSYFNMLFSFLKEKNSNFYQYFYKLKILESLSLFWKCLNIRLKTCQELCEFLMHKSLECLFNNCFIKTLRLKIDLDEIEFSSINSVLGVELIKQFNETLVKFINQISFENKEDVLFFYLIEIVLKNEKAKKLNPYEQIDFCASIDPIKSQAKTVFNILDELQIPIPVFDLIRLAFDYHFLKDCYEPESSVSVIENFMLVYTLLKKVEQTPESRFTESIFESKRKIKLYLLDDLYYLNKMEKNHLLMSFVRKEQADLLQWENESSLKEILYLKSLKKFAINSLQEKFLVQESPYLTEYYKSVKNSDKDGFLKSMQFEICKQLSGYYEKLDENYPKITRILNAETKFTQLMSNLGQVDVSKNHGHLYFRVGLFGRGLKFESIQNKYYLYKHKSYEMLSNIQNLIRNKLAYSKWCENENESLMSVNNVAMLHHNQEPDGVVKDSQKCYIQICAVNKFEKRKFLELVEENLLDQENKQLNEILENLKSDDITQSYYYFDRPFYVKNYDNLVGSIIDDLEDFERVKENESVDNLWIERSVLIIDESKYDNISQFEEIKSTVKIYLNPIRNAITDINEKTKELKNFVVQFTANNSQNTNMIHGLQPLTMRLLGCLDARVNGGLIKYVKELLNESVYMNKKYANNRKKLFNQLYISIKNQLNVLESGLSIHDRILTNIEENLSDPSENITEHVKHMNELNKHLIECLKIVQNELDDRWSKIF